MAQNPYQVSKLQRRIHQQVIQTGDFEAADQFTEIFIELAFSNMQQIIDQGSPLIDILLALLEMDESDCHA